MTSCPEVKYDPRKGGPAQRIADRRKNSGDAKHADYVIQGDKGTITNVHHSRNQQYGEGQSGLDIHGNKRGVV